MYEEFVIIQVNAYLYSKIQQLEGIMRVWNRVFEMMQELT